MMTCPFCSQLTTCTANEHCWCFARVIPDELLTQLPNAEVGRNCICEQCLNAYQSDPERFIAAAMTKPNG